MSKNKENRTRSAHFHFWATEKEAALIRQRMAATGIISFGAFARKMLIQGYHIHMDLSDVRKMVVLLSRCSANINQIAKRANETRSIYAVDVEDIRRQYASLWAAANKILAGLAKIQ